MPPDQTENCKTMEEIIQTFWTIRHQMHTLLPWVGHAWRRQYMTRPVTHNNQVKLHDRKCYIQRQVSSRTDSRIHFVLGKECKSKVRVLMIDGHVLRTSSPRKSICAKVQSSCIVWSSKGTIPSQSHFQLLNHQVTIIRAQKYLGTLYNRSEI